MSEEQEHPVTMMSVAHLMGTYAPVYPEGGNWEATIAYMCERPNEMLIVDELIRQLSQQGRFRDPVLVCEEQWEGEPYRVVRDGTHRVIAAHLSGINSIPVQLTDDEFIWNLGEDDNHEDMFVSTLHLTAGTELSLEEDEVIFAMLRSIPLSDEEWLTADMFTGSRNYFRAYWTEPTARITDLNDVLLHRLTTRFPDRTFTVATVGEPWDSE